MMVVVSRHFLQIFGLLLVFATFPSVAPACIWVDGSTIDGHSKRYNGMTHLELLWLAMKQTPGDKLGSLKSTLPHDGGAADREKEAVKKMLSGEAAVAIPLLLKNEQELPGNYSTAANLGTAYELAGDNRNALKWINEGILRNAKSHEGTEWLHALVLETKLRLEQDPDYLKTHRIIPLPEKFNAKTEIDVGGAKRSLGEIVWALNYQLRERTVFVKPPDPIVADLLFTYAIGEAHTAVLEGAIKLLDKSQEYGFQDLGLIEATKKRYQAIVENTGRKREVWKFLKRAGIVLIIFGVPVGIYYWCRRNWFSPARVSNRSRVEAAKDPY